MKFNFFRKWMSLLLIGGMTISLAQAQKDSLSVLSYDAYMNRVKAHHPLSLQAQLQVEMGEAGLRQSRGLFDPKMFTDVAQKYFDNSEYYSLIDGGLKVPTWFGLELSSGYEQNRGVFLNPENKVPDVGLWYAGISLPIGKGLFIDERRAELRKAQAYVNITNAERRLMLNDLFYQAGQVYWNWYGAYHSMKVYETGLNLALVRQTAVQQGAILGDRPFIDTLEAGIQVQNRRLSLQQATVDFRNATALLEVYLWAEGMLPVEVNPGTIPEALAGATAIPLNETLAVRLDSLVANHPSLEKIEFKIDQLEVERRWNREQLKPELNLNYKPITEALTDDPLAAYTVNNYTWGLDFSFPIFLRKERGKLQLTNLKLQEAGLEVKAKQAALEYKATAALNDWRLTAGLVELSERNSQDYFSLLEGERELFDIGESSLFLVNSREVGYINARLKLIETLAKNRKAQLTTEFTLGLMAQ